MMVSNPCWPHNLFPTLTVDLGLHLSGDGYKILYQEIRKTIIKAYPELRPSSIPVALEPFFPDWFEDSAPW